MYQNQFVTKMNIELVKFGFNYGILLALISLGFALIYNVLKIVDFSHTDRITVAGYSFYISTGYFNIYLSIIISLIVASLFAILTERIIYSTLRTKGSSALMLSSFCFSLITQSLLILIFQSDQKTIKYTEHAFDYSGFFPRELILIPFLLIFLFLLDQFFRRNRIGISIRAIISNYERAVFFKLPVNQYISIVFGISGLLAGVAGVSLAISNGVVPTMGFKFMIYSFAACIIGGFRSLFGVVIVSIGFGILINIAEAYTSALASEGIALGLLLIILLLKPKGLFSEKLRII